MKRILLLTSALVLVVAPLAGCPKGPKITAKNAPAPQLEGGWNSHDSGNGFTIGSPNTWKRNPPTAISGMMSEMGGNAPQDNGPDQPSADEQERMTKANELFCLYDNTQRPLPGEKMTKLSVAKESFSGTLADAEKEGKKALGSGATSKAVELPIGTAYEIRSATQNIGGDTENEILYVVVHDYNLYKFKFFNTNNMAAIDTVAKPIMDTLRFSGAAG